MAETEVETRRANGESRLDLAENLIKPLNIRHYALLSVRSDHLVVALRVSTSDYAALRPPLKMTHGGHLATSDTWKSLICKHPHNHPFNNLSYIKMAILSQIIGIRQPFF